ncbi:hypothetical protein HN385_00600 [archaeon]|jgi:hypothetical protein|nr:hypothetical protein [archaeon]MBT3451577.1 hypothetical protein [archaeon]MBT6869597.1 hypothetical protein [archaeon]MBT7192366.1 hypothetical protein [archaeon]MBT7380167.1 hypothetical protein [archaeon]
MLNLREKVLNFISSYLSPYYSENEEFINLCGKVNLLENYDGDLSDGRSNVDQFQDEIDRVASLATMHNLPEDLNEYFSGRMVGMGPTGNIYNQYVNKKIRREGDFAIFANLGFGNASSYAEHLESLKDQCRKKGVVYAIGVINNPIVEEDKEPIFEDDKFGTYNGELFVVEVSVPEFGYSKRIIRTDNFLREQVVFTDKHGLNYWADLNQEFEIEEINSPMGIISNKRSREFKEFEAKRLQVEMNLYYELTDFVAALYKPLIPF